MWTLSLNDLFLLSVIGTEHLLTKSEINLRTTHDIICKCVYFFGTFTPQVSAWITVVIAVERMLYVCVPIKMYKSNVKRRSVIALSSIFLISFVLNIEVLFSASVTVYSFTKNETISICQQYADEEKTSEMLSMISYGIFTFLLPFLLITISNVITLVTVCKSRRIARESTNQQRSTRNITKVVASISIVHCVSTLPYAIIMYWRYARLFMLISQFMHYAYISYLFNSGFNFVLYCLFGESFWQDLKEMVTHLLHFCRFINESSIRNEQRSTGSKY